jgi:hypothetical protein
MTIVTFWRLTLYNYRPALDTALPFSFHSEGHWRRATQADRSADTRS